VRHDERLLLGSSFGAAATAYAEHRPDCAQAAVRWALERAPGLRVLDLGAGTGKLTATLVALGADVVAVEPDPAMLAELCRALPGSADSTIGSTGLPNSSRSAGVRPLVRGTRSAVGPRRDGRRAPSEQWPGRLVRLA
jgi:SAM-dependent methyltransferase